MPGRTETLQVEAVELDPKTMSRDQWTLFHEYRRARHAEERPDDPINPDEATEAEMKLDNPESEVRRFGAFVDGKMVGALTLSTASKVAPAYDSNKHLMRANLAVLGPYRRRGIGTMWIRKAVEGMEHFGNTVLTLMTEEDDGHAFLRWLGAEERFSGAENRLDFRKIDWPKIERWAAEGVEKSPETKLLFYEDRLPEDVMDEYCPVISEVLMTMPFEDLDHGDIVLTPELLKKWYENMDLLGEEHHTYMTREPDGSISSMTDVFWSPHNPTLVWQGFTGVKPGYRGRGLGKWIKASMLLWLREHYEDIQWIVTDNAGSNQWMLAINEELGFRQYKKQSTYQIGIDDLKKHLSRNV